jgi:hypothetical protein
MGLLSLLIGKNEGSMHVFMVGEAAQPLALATDIETCLGRMCLEAESDFTLLHVVVVAGCPVIFQLGSSAFCYHVYLLFEERGYVQHDNLAGMNI